MFTFFRRYQRFFFLLITIVIVLSFSFFGTYSTLQSPTVDTTVIAYDVRGREIRASTLQSYVAYLGVEADDLSFGNTTGCNPLNPGIISREIIANGLYKALQPQLITTGQLLQEKLERELKYKPIIQAQHIWGYFAPQITENLQAFQQPASTSNQLIDRKMNLFASERQFPPIASYQALQYFFGQAAAKIDPSQLSLFGYTSIEDWFGKSFIESAALFIYNAARIAESNGLEVSQDEATIYMVEQAKGFLETNPYAKALGYSSVGEVVAGTLKRLGIDQVQLLTILRDTLLFKKLFLQVETGAISTRKPFEQLLRASGQYVDVELFTLPSMLETKTEDQICKIQYWIDAVGVPPQAEPSQPNWQQKLALPKETRPLDEVKKHYPQLVQKRFYVEWSAISIDDIKGKIALRSVWNWQTNSAGWALLSKEFPEVRELELADQESPEHRFSALETLSKVVRGRIDDWSKGEMVRQNRELVVSAIKDIPTKKEEIFVRLQKSVLPFKGIENGVALEKLLHEAPIAEEFEPLSCYSQDNKTFVRIVVLDKSQDFEVVPLKQALQDGTLENSVDALLETSYKKLRNQDQKKYLDQSGDWKPLSAVRKEILESQYKSLFVALEQAKAFYKPIYPNYCNWENTSDYRRAVRFLPHLVSTYDKLKQDPSTVVEYTVEKEACEEGFVNAPKEGKLDFRLVRRTERMFRSEQKGLFTAQELFVGAVPPQVTPRWLDPKFTFTNGPLFAIVQGQGEEINQNKIAKRVIDASKHMGRELGIAYARLIAQEMNVQRSPLVGE